MTAKTNKEIGSRGEKAAVRFLERRGYEIIDLNWSCDFGEVDIICKDRDTLVFVEVKTRTSIDKGLPEDAVGPAKRKRYEKIAASYIRVCEYSEIPVRFDVIAILVVDSNRALIRHHINAFGEM